MYYPPLHQNKYVTRGGFWTPTGKIECNSTILRELGYPGMPTYLPCAENDIDNPELAEEYPIVLTTGGGFMPYHHSEHFQMQGMRYLYPDPYYSINPELAEKLDIEHGDWCWIETQRGRIKMRANVEPEVDPRVVFVPRGWWFPERDTNIDLDNPFGCLESNTNVLTSVDEWDCDPMGGSWANRGLMCKVYKCTEADHEWNAKDKTWSIPGCAKNPGISTDPEDLKHRVLRWEKIPFEAPACTKEVPEGFSWQWQNDALYQDSTQFRLDDSGWLIDPKTNEYVDAHTGWYYVAAENCLMDKATGKKYTMEREEIAELAGIRLYPGQDAPYAVPEQLTWDREKGYARLGDKPYIYNPESGWLIRPCNQRLP